MTSVGAPVSTRLVGEGAAATGCARWAGGEVFATVFSHFCRPVTIESV